jgi:hypothetical protein
VHLTGTLQGAVRAKVLASFEPILNDELDSSVDCFELLLKTVDYCVGDLGFGSTFVGK